MAQLEQRRQAALLAAHAALSDATLPPPQPSPPTSAGAAVTDMMDAFDDFFERHLSAAQDEPRQPEPQVPAHVKAFARAELVRAKREPTVDLRRDAAYGRILHACNRLLNTAGAPLVLLGWTSARRADFARALLAALDVPKPACVSQKSIAYMRVLLNGSLADVFDSRALLERLVDGSSALVDWMLGQSAVLLRSADDTRQLRSLAHAELDIFTALVETAEFDNDADFAQFTARPDRARQLAAVVRLANGVHLRALEQPVRSADSLAHYDQWHCDLRTVGALCSTQLGAAAAAAAAAHGAAHKLAEVARSVLVLSALDLAQFYTNGASLVTDYDMLAVSDPALISCMQYFVAHTMPTGDNFVMRSATAIAADAVANSGSASAGGSASGSPLKDSDTVLDSGCVRAIPTHGYVFTRADVALEEFASHTRSLDESVIRGALDGLDADPLAAFADVMPGFDACYPAAAGVSSY
jgi:hypothetical protein